MPIKVEVKFDAEPILLKLDAIRVSMPVATERAVDRLADLAVTTWKEFALERTSTGRYRENIVIKNRVPGGAVVGVNEDRVRYFPFIENDTEPHSIEAVRAKSLRFFWGAGPAGPGVYFFRKVQHPGTKGAHHAERTGEIVNEQAKNVVREVIEEMIEERVETIRGGG